MSVAPGRVALPLVAAQHLLRSVQFHQVSHHLPVGDKPREGGWAWQPDSRPGKVMSDIQLCKVGMGECGDGPIGAGSRPVCSPGCWQFMLRALVSELNKASNSNFLIWGLRLEESFYWNQNLCWHYPLLGLSIPLSRGDKKSLQYRVCIPGNSNSQSDDQRMCGGLVRLSSESPGNCWESSRDLLQTAAAVVLGPCPRPLPPRNSLRVFQKDPINRSQILRKDILTCGISGSFHRHITPHSFHLSWLPRFATRERSFEETVPAPLKAVRSMYLWVLQEVYELPGTD